MIEAMIQDGDVVIMRPVKDPQGIREGTIVAARVESGTTLKSFYRQGNQVQLKPANPNYPVMEFPADLVDVQGRLVAVWRGMIPDLPSSCWCWVSSDSHSAYDRCCDYNSGFCGHRGYTAYRSQWDRP
jgi:hypothetical protein